MLRATGERLLGHPALALWSRIVAAACPDDTAYHMGVAGALPYAHPLSLSETSPLAPVVTTSDWQSAPRVEMDLLHELYTPPFNRKVIDRLSPCLVPGPRATD